MRMKWLALLLVVLAAGCPDVEVDPGETQGTLPALDGPTVEFDPAASIIPFPNNLLIDPTTGKVNIPATPCETPAAMAVRTQVLNQLNGFGTFEVAIQATFTEPVDPATLEGNIVLLQRTKGMAANDPTTIQPVPITVAPSTTLRFDPNNCAMPATVNAVTIVPKIPLDEGSTYTVAILAGLKTASGQGFLPSPTWALIRQAQNPVTLAPGCNPVTFENCTVVVNNTPLDPLGDANANGVPDLQELVGLDTLWKAHAQAMAFLEAAGHMRQTVLLAWEFTTQTTTDPLDPMVPTSPAAMLATNRPIVGTTSVVPPAAACTPAQGCTAFLTAAGLPCGSLPCTAVGDVLGGALAVGASTYQTHTPNPLPGGADIPGPWTDPVAPMVQDPFASPIGPGLVEVLMVVPNGAPPAAGWPTVVFGHGLARHKKDMFAIAPQLAAAGFASVAIDFVDHGSRAVRISDDPMLGCAPGHCSATTGQACDAGADACPSGESCVGGPDPTVVPQCFAPFLSDNLATTRDNVRQTVLDLQLLINSVRACGTTQCGELKVDPMHVVYMGQSLGGIIGSTTTAVSPGLQSAVLNVPGVGWVDILENTANLQIRCTLVDSLIDAGIVMGDKWNGQTDPAKATGTCTTDEWKQQPGYQQFASTARWVLDPADGANFTPMLAMRRILIQEVVDDQVVPNIATDNEGMLVGLTPATADPFSPATPTTPAGASAAITTNLMASKWLRYPSLPASDPDTGGFGNLFAHGSLLAPAPSPGHCSNDPSTTCTMDADCGAGACVFPGALGTARMQTDAITFLLGNH